MIHVGLPSKDQSLLKQILPVLKRADLDSEQVTVGLVRLCDRPSSAFIGLQVTVERREAACLTLHSVQLYSYSIKARQQSRSGALHRRSLQ